MKIICSKERLVKALSIAESVISSKNSISILSNVLLEAKEGKIKISASETKLNFFTEIGAEIIEEGSASVFCNKIYNITRKLPGDEISIITDENDQFFIEPKDKSTTHFVLKGINSDKYPPIQSISDITFISIPQEKFVDMVKRTIFAMSVTENRRFVSGLYLEANDSFLKMVATDGKRLALITKNLKVPLELSEGIIIPPKILYEVLKLCSGNGDIQISLNNKNIFVNIDNYFFISNLIEGKFPPYENVIPKDLSKIFIISKQALYDSLDRISQIGDKESHKIVFSISNNNLEVFSEDITHGSGTDIVPIDYNDEPIKIALNYQFILDVVNIIKSDNIIFKFKDSQSTVSIFEEGNDEYIYIMMPMSL